jgi:ATP-binding cassette, subfamily C, bacterial
LRVLIDFARAKPLHALVTVVCLLVAGLAEGLALTSLLPLISIASRAGEGVATDPSKLERYVVDGFHAAGLEPTLSAMLLLVPALFATKSALLLLARRQNGYAVARVVRELRLRMLRALLQARWSYFVTHPLGMFSNAYHSEAERTAKAYFNAVSCVAMSIQLAVYLTIALVTSWKLTLASFVFAGAVLWALHGLVRMARRGGIRQTKLSRLAMNSLTDVLQGLKPLKTMAREHLALPWIEGPTLRLEKSWRKQVLAREALAAIQEPIFVALVCGAIYVLRVALGFELGEVLLLAAALALGFASTSKLQRRYQEVLVDQSAYVQLIEHIQEIENARERRHGGAEPSLRQGIAFRRVAFDHGRTALFSDLSLEIRAGEITALVGPSGAGKTSIADLVAGIVEPQSGEVLIDGTPLSAVDLTRWRQQIGYVPQEPFLLHESIALNVSLGDPQISRADVERALRSAHAWEFVEAMPQGMDTVVGERGSSLSGGQRQRVSIARALVHRPWLLVLDEATAALDPESEAAVWQALKELRGGTTILAISHQQALMEVADRVYRIESGTAQPLDAKDWSPS